MEGILNEHGGRHGRRRTGLELRKIGIAASVGRVPKVTRAKNPRARATTRRHRAQRRIGPGGPRINLVERVPAVSSGSGPWVGDVTYVPTRGGLPCLATVTGAPSRKVVGWSMAAHMRENLVMDAPGQAVNRENPPDRGLVSHDDRGTRRASRAFQEALGRHGITQSASRPGDPCDDAVAESSSRTLRTGLARGQACEDQEGARQEIFKHVELYHDTKRMHSTLGHMSPCDFERQSA